MVDLGADVGADYGHVVADHEFCVEVGEEGESGHGSLEEGGGESHCVLCGGSESVRLRGELVRW